jgi:hypothetical protein
MKWFASLMSSISENNQYSVRNKEKKKKDAENAELPLLLKRKSVLTGILNTMLCQNPLTPVAHTPTNLDPTRHRIRLLKTHFTVHGVLWGGVPALTIPAAHFRPAFAFGVLCDCFIRRELDIVWEGEDGDFPNGIRANGKRYVMRSGYYGK